MSIYILYIYIYICAGCINYKPYPQVCVCVCVCVSGSIKTQPFPGFAISPQRSHLMFRNILEIQEYLCNFPCLA